MEINVQVEPQRIDKFLSENTAYSRSQIHKMIEAGYILVNGQKVKVSYMINLDDKITIKDGFIQPVNLKAENITLDIVYEDDDLMVINKPSGMVVHPGSGRSAGTLVNALIHHTQNLSDKSGDIRPGIVHRLDKDTSGLMLVAKNNQIHEVLANGFKNKTIKRIYLALLVGELTTATATIDAPIGRDPRERKKMTVTAQQAKTAITHLTVLKRYQGYTLVSLALDTGRTHQIRVHMRYIGYPVYNDPVYGQTGDEFGQFLHSAELTFIHPKTGKTLHFKADLPKLFQSFLNELDLRD